MTYSTCAHTDYEHFAISKWSPWISRFNALGYSCMSIDVDCATKRLEDFEEG